MVTSQVGMAEVVVAMKVVAGWGRDGRVVASL